MRGRAGRWLVLATAAVTLAAGRGAHAVSIDVAPATGAPGEVVAVAVSLRGEGATVVATQNLLAFGRDVFVAPRANGQPDCTVNPAIEKEATGFRFVPVECDPTADCTAVRVFVLSFQSLDPIPDGLLYTCQVQIAADTPPGEYPLALAELGVSLPGGVLAPADGTPGVITVVAEPAARVVVGEASGPAGGTAALDVTLALLDGEAAIDALTVDLVADAGGYRFATGAGAAPACSADAALGREASLFAFLPDGCDPATDCAVMRATLRAESAVPPIADGARLFTCTLALTGAPGSYPVPALAAVGFDADGAELVVLTADGTVTIDAPPPSCPGDCDGDRAVAINELLVGVNLLIGISPPGACDAFDTDGDGEITVAELIQAVNAALNGCA